MNGKSFAVFRLACEVKRLWLTSGMLAYVKYQRARHALERLTGRSVMWGRIV